MEENKKRSKGKLIAIIIIALVAIFIIYRLLPKKVSLNEDARPTVLVEEPELRDIYNETDYIGTMQPQEEVNVIPMMAGEILTVNFNIGDHVNAGDVLATLKADSLDSLKIQVDANKIQADDAAKALSRTQELYDAGAVSKQTLESAQSGAKSAKLAYEAALNQYNITYDYANITAPISGIIESKNADIHAIASQGIPICSISSGEGISVSFGVSESTMKNINIGDNITIEKDSSSYDGKITEISTKVSQTSGLFEVKAAILAQSSDALPSGTKTKVVVISKSSTNVLSIPLSAISYSDGNPFIYLYGDDGTAIKTDITTGIYDDTYIEVTDGLNASDKVITTWSNELYDGTAVSVKGQE